MQQFIDILLKSGGPWAALLIIVSVYFTKEKQKTEEKHKAELDRINAEHKAAIAATNAITESQVNKAISERDASLSSQNRMQVEHAARIQELNSAIQSIQAEQYQHRLRDQDEFRKALLTREQEVISALTESASASEEQSAAMDRLQELMLRLVQQMEQFTQSKGRKTP